MSTALRPLSEMVQQLPPQAQAQLRDFVEFLLAKHRRREGGKLRQNWAGALRKYRDRYTSLELQKEALNWRSG